MKKRDVILCWKRGKRWWELRKSLLITLMGHHCPLPQSCFQNTLSLSQAYSRQGLRNHSLENLNEHTYWHLRVSSNKRTSCCFIALKKNQQPTSPVHMHRGSDLIFCTLLLILALNKQPRISKHLRKAYKMEVWTKMQRKKKAFWKMQPLQGTEKMFLNLELRSPERTSCLKI